MHLAEAVLEEGVPLAAGLFVINVRHSRWMHNSANSVCPFGGEGDSHFDDLGVSLFWLEPGRPMSLYPTTPGRRTSSC